MIHYINSALLFGIEQTIAGYVQNGTGREELDLALTRLAEALQKKRWERQQPPKSGVC